MQVIDCTQVEVKSLRTVKVMRVNNKSEMRNGLDESQSRICQWTEQYSSYINKFLLIYLSIII